jgi:high affinity Mn2+ porin
MGSYGAALAVAQQTGAAPDTAAVRQMAWRPGIALNLEQAIGAEAGVFARASWNDGSRETYEFTEINRSLSAGVSLAGGRWGRPHDAAGLAAAVNGLSSAARGYFAAGGLGVLIGDGRLPDYGFEKIAETYYAARLNEHMTFSADFQYVVNPAYSAGRGPVSIFGVRIHAEL